MAASGPFHPAGINVVPVPPGDTLDPQGLNKPLSPAEQQAIADTFNSILTGQPYSIVLLDPHNYKNWLSDVTSAILPQSTNPDARASATTRSIPIATTGNFGYACKILGIDPIEASEALHAAKRAANLGGADNCTFDLDNGDILFDGEHIGNLGD